MDICRNLSVSGGLQYQQQPPEYQLGSLDDLFSGHPLEEEGDVNMEWLSTFVEECLSSTGHCLLPPTTQQKQLMQPPTPKPTQLLGIGNNTASFSPHPPHPFQLDKLVVIPVKGTRSKRKRSQSQSHLTTTRATRPSWWSPPPPPPQNHQVLTSADPPLLQQAYWLADSELIFPQKHLIPNTTIYGHGHEHEKVAVRQGRGRRKKKHHNHNHKEEEGEEELEEGSSSNGGVGGGGGIRRCSHCLSQRTPQWRAGPLGPKTLCNACGVRYKSGRLLPEYRPAKSPSFVSYMHSNSHKKVLEMRTLSSSTSSSPSPSS